MRRFSSADSMARTVNPKPLAFLAFVFLHLSWLFFDVFRLKAAQGPIQHSGRAT